MAHPPKNLQAILWSADVKDLDLHQNRAYIIHQVLAFGTMDDLRWLFQTYGKKTIREVFMQQPIKAYTPSSFHFCKLLLNIPPEEAPAYLYDHTIPRRIR